MTKKKNGKKKRWPLYALIAIIIIIALGVFLKNKNAPKGEEVETSFVQNRDIRESVSASGRIYPEIEVIISSDVSGEIVQLYVKEGDSVVAGQVLIKIDPEAYLSSVERGQANLDNAKASLSMSQAQILTNIAQREELQTQLNQAKRNHDRNVQLFKEGIASQAQFDETLAQVENAQASIRSADANIKAAKESARGSEFTVKSSEASLRELRTNLGRTTIKAPSSGIISSLSVEKGERVVGTAQMAGTEIMRISDMSTMEVQVEVSENDIVKVALGDTVEIEVDAYLNRKFIGNVTQIANSAANVASATGATTTLNTDRVTNFIVKIRVAPSSYTDLKGAKNKFPFRPGMSASVDIITNVKKQVKCVPIQAVTVRLNDESEKQKTGKDYKEVVFAYTKDTAQLIEVKTGIQDDEYIQIVSEIKDSLELVSGPYSTISKLIESGTLLRRKEENKDAKKK